MKAKPTSLSISFPLHDPMCQFVKSLSIWIACLLWCIIKSSPLIETLRDTDWSLKEYPIAAVFLSSPFPNSTSPPEDSAVTCLCHHPPMLVLRVPQCKCSHSGRDSWCCCPEHDPHSSRSPPHDGGGNTALLEKKVVVVVPEVRLSRDGEMVDAVAAAAVVESVDGTKMKPNPNPTCILGTLHALLGLPCYLQHDSPLMLLVDSIWNSWGIVIIHFCKRQKTIKSRSVFIASS